MLILVVGVVGGAGATTLAEELLRHSTAVGLDAGDGQLAARRDRATYTLETLAFARRDTQQVIDRIVQQRPTLLWTPACRLHPEKIWRIVQAVADRIAVVVDGGLTPPPAVWELAQVQLAVTRSAEDAVTRWHSAQLRQAHPALRLVSGDLKAAGAALAAELWPEAAPRWSLPGALASWRSSR